MNITNYNTNQLRSYASILSNTTIKKLVRGESISVLDNKIEKYDSDKKGITYKEYFSYIFNELNSYYRNEFVYKNILINKLLLGKYSVNTTVALNEFKIGDSIADLVLINGSSKVFEIKTELDSSTRLESQISDYKKVFSDIYLVTHESLCEKYLGLLPLDIGLIILTKSNRLSTIRNAVPNMQFDNELMISCLRKNEYSNIILKYYGSLPDVQPIRFYRECKALFNKIPSIVAHELMNGELKKRKLKCKEMLISDSIPFELKSICLNLDFNEKEYIKLKELLKLSLT